MVKKSLVLILFAICGWATEATSQIPGRTDQNPRVFYRSLGEPEYLDPGRCTENEGGTVINDTFDGLFRYGPTAKEWPKALCESYTLSEDGKTYTFKLRKDGKWSDGVPVTAHDFEFAWKRVLDPATASRYADILRYLEGAVPFTKSKPEQRDELRDKVGVKAKDDYTLVVKLTDPIPYFIQLTAFYSYMPVPKHVVEKHGDDWVRMENIVCNGPWKITEWENQQKIVAERNPHYYEDDLPFDKIVYRITQTNEPAHNMYLSGDLDFLDSRIPESALTKYILEGFDQLQAEPYMAVYYYLINCKEKPFDNPKVRHALNLAIDKEQIGRFVIKGKQPPAPSIVPPQLEEVGYESPETDEYEFDPDLARDYLAEAGFPGGKGFPRFKITFNTLEGHRLVAQYVQQQWKKELGIDVELNNMEWKVLLKQQHAHQYQVSRTAWIGDFIDPMTFLDLFKSDNPNNRTQWANEEYDRLILAATAETNPEERFELLRQAEEVFLEEMPSIPLYFYRNYDLVKPYLKGYSSHLQDNHLTRYFSIKVEN